MERERSSETRLPFSVAEAALSGLHGNMVAMLSRRGASTADVVLSGLGKATRLDHFESRVLKKGAAGKAASAAGKAAPAADWSYACEWAPVASAAADPSQEARVLLVGDRRGTLAAALGRSVARRAESGSASELREAGALDGVVLVAPPRAAAALGSIASALTIVQWQMDLPAAVPVWVCTHLTQPVASVRRSSSEHAGLWGFARSMRQELTFPLNCIDVVEVDGEEPPPEPQHRRRVDAQARAARRPAACRHAGHRERTYPPCPESHTRSMRQNPTGRRLYKIQGVD